LPLCAAAHPLRTIFANVFGTSVAKATMRPNPAAGGGGHGAAGRAPRHARRPPRRAAGQPRGALRLEVSSHPPEKYRHFSYTLSKNAAENSKRIVALELPSLRRRSVHSVSEYPYQIYEVAFCMALNNVFARPEGEAEAARRKSLQQVHCSPPILYGESL
jgi:hypothetical protein